MSDHMQDVKEWARSFRADVQAVKAVVDNEAIDAKARQFAAAALNYLVTRMDLVPDWNDTIGILDDVMVLRVCLRLANAYDVTAHLDGDNLAKVARMVADVDTIEAFLGEELYGKFRKHCSRLTDTVVRGRSPEGIVEERAVRKALYEEIDDDILRMPATSFDNPAEVAVHFTSYLHHKLS